MDQQIINQQQGQWLIDQGWVSLEQVERAYFELADHPSMDLCSILVSHGELSREQAHVARMTAGKISAADDHATVNLDSIQSMGSLVNSHRTTNSVESLVSNELLHSIFDSSNPLRFQGMTLGNGVYEVLGEIRRGGMGIVLRGRRRPSGEEVAIKMLMDRKSSEKITARFQREVETLSKLKHANIVKVIDQGLERGLPYYVMEYVVGQDLKIIVEDGLRKRGRVPDFDWTLSALAPVAKALRYCHAKGVIHRDVKPSNILVESSTKHPVLIDFGVVKRDPSSQIDDAKASGDTKLTRSEEIVGTPAFMSPEQLAPKGDFGEVSPATDVWGLGVTLYFCLTGTRIYREVSVANFIVALLNRDPEPPRNLNPEVPRWLNDLCMACLQRRAEDRPSMSAVADCLIHRRSPGGTRLISQLSSAFTGRSRVGGALAAFALILMAAVVAAVFLFSAETRPPDNGDGDKVTPPKVDAVRAEKTRFLERNLAQLKAVNPVARYNAILELASLEVSDYPKLEKKRRKALADCLEDSNADARREAIRAFGGLKDIAPPVFQSLVLGLEDDDPAVRKTAVEVLTRIGPEAVVHLIPALTNTNAPVARLGAFEVIENLARRLEDKNTLVSILPVIRDMTAADDEADEKVRRAAIRAVYLIEGGEDFKALLEKARAYAKEGKTELAEASFEKAIAIEEGGVQATLARARYFVAKERYSKALADLNRAGERAPRSTEALLQRAEYYRLAKDRANALRDYDDAVALAPADPAVLLARARFHYGLGDYKKALEGCDAALDKAPGKVEALKLRARTQHYLGQHDKEEEDYTRIVAATPEDPSAYMIRAAVRRDLERYEDALADYDRAEKYSADRLEVVRGRLETYLAMKRYAEAKTLVNYLINQVGQDAELLAKRGRILRSLRDFEGAIKDYDIILGRELSEAKAADYHYERGLTYDTRGDAQRAKGEEEAAKASFRAAIEDYSAAIKNDPNPLYYYVRARVYENGVRELAQAYEDYTRSIGLNPSLHYSYEARGLLLIRIRRYKEARADFDKALDLAPNASSVYFSRSFLWTALKDFDKALEDLETSLEKQPKVGVVHYNLACVYAQRARSHPNTEEGRAKRQADISAALEQIEVGAEYDYRDWKHIAGDNDLTAMREDPRYAPLMERLKKKYGG